MLASYRHHFNRLTGLSEPHHWQSALASTEDCRNRLIRIPTGFGKTLGVLSAWTYHRIHLAQEHWPHRLVWCLPMRVLVEQTEKEVRKGLASLDLLWDENGSHSGKVGVHLLMGGADSGEWHLDHEDLSELETALLDAFARENSSVPATSSIEDESEVSEEE